MNTKAIGSKVRETREARNLSQVSLATIARTQQSRISKIENGRQITLPVLLRVLRSLDLSLHVSIT